MTSILGFFAGTRIWLALAACCFAGASAAAPAADRIESVSVDGTAFRIVLQSGAVLEGVALEGATLSLALPGQSDLSRVRLDRIVPAPDDDEVLLYEMSVLDPATGNAVPLCEADAKGERWAFPLKGQWNEAGERISGEGLTLACAAGGALGKCVRWGYKPWKIMADGTSLAPYHQACVRMVRADYCGDGTATTRDGMMIDVFDTLNVNPPEPARAKEQGLTFEAAWGPQGAVCVAHTRVPENMTLDRLEKTCPRLNRHLGVQNCLETEAKAKHYGDVLLFNHSR